MIIDDGALAKALKREAKAGIKLLADGEVMRLLFGKVRVVLILDIMEKLPKLTLAALVEMLGYIPRNCCIEVHKNKDGYTEQDVLDSAFAAESDLFSIYGQALK
jgi:hypothetical protein